MPQRPLRDTVAIPPLLVLVAILCGINYGIVYVVPGTSQTLIASAAVPSTTELDKKCLEQYDYHCDYPAKNKYGRQCGYRMDVETATVKGWCVQADFAQGTHYKDLDQQWKEVGKPKTFSGPIFNESTGQWEVSWDNPPPETTPDENYAARILREPIPYGPNTTYGDDGKLADIPELLRSPNYRMPELGGDFGNQIPHPLPPEYQPLPTTHNAQQPGEVTQSTLESSFTSGEQIDAERLAKFGEPEMKEVNVPPSLQEQETISGSRGPAAAPDTSGWAERISRFGETAFERLSRIFKFF